MGIIYIVQIIQDNDLGNIKYYYFDDDHEAMKCEDHFNDLYNSQDFDIDGFPTNPDEGYYEVSCYSEPVNVPYL